MAKKEKPFNNPFGALTVKKSEPSATAPKAPPPRLKPSPKAAVSADEEARLFLESVGAVEPVRRAQTARVAPGKTPPLAVPVTVDDADVLAQLTELVSGDAGFELSSLDSPPEGHLVGLDRRILTRLRSGEYPVELEMDLHGMKRSEAQAALEKFLVAARQAKRRCVLVVTGRGLNSPDGIAVLREGVRSWLSQGRSGRQVLAFTPARPEDGGPGAVYVLLRR